MRFYNGHFGLLSFSRKYNVSLEWLLGGAGNGPRRVIRLATMDGKRVA